MQILTKQFGIEIAQNDDYDCPWEIIRSFIKGYFSNIALLQVNGTYKTPSGQNTSLTISANSVLCNIKPKVVMFTWIEGNEMEYVSDIEIEDVIELVPGYYWDFWVQNKMWN